MGSSPTSESMLKRYEYWSSEGKVWTKWFKWDGPKMPSPMKGLKVEYKEEDDSEANRVHTE